MGKVIDEKKFSKSKTIDKIHTMGYHKNMK